MVETAIGLTVAMLVLTPQPQLKMPIMEVEYIKVVEAVESTPEPTVKQTKEQKITNQWNVKLTKEERKLLAKIVFLEAGNQSNKGQCAVINVILNRMTDERFPNTLQAVLSQKNQFSTYKNRNKAKPTQQVYDNIDKVLKGDGFVLGLGYVYFRSERDHSFGKNTIKIGDHWFSE